MRLIEASPNGYILLNQFQTLDEKRATLVFTDFMQPALSRGRLCVRTPEELICYDLAGR